MLKEFGIRLNEVEAYNGTISSTNWVDRTQWQSLYFSLYTMRVGTNTTMTAPDAVYSHFDSQQAANPGVILLAAQYYSYQQYKTNAYTNGDVTVTNDRIYDVSGRNPYDTKTAFAVFPSENYLEGNSFEFKLQGNMIYTNSGQTLSSVQIDFGNGSGYQTVSLNNSINVSYSSGGEKELKVKFVYSGGPTLYSHSKLYVEYISPYQSLAFDQDNFLPGWENRAVTGAAWNGSSATGNITIELADNNGIFDRPLIVVEGFDPENEYNYHSLITGQKQGLFVDLGSGNTLNDEIEEEGYDLVFVDYQNSLDYIQRNAYMLEAVIDSVNAMKVGTEEIAVIGVSMGGLVARYALAHMEATSKTHEAKLFVSFDSPQQGANVPLAYQAMVRHLAGESIKLPVFLGLFSFDVFDLDKIAPDLTKGMNIVQSPAAQQMLIYQLQGSGSTISIDNSTLHHSFSSELQNLGYPSQGNIKNIAIAHGNECADTMDFGPHATLVDMDKKLVDLPFLLTNFIKGSIDFWTLRSTITTISSFLSTNTDVQAEFNLKALPDQQSLQIYKGKIFIKKTVLFFINVEEQLIDQKTLNSSSSMLALDNASGGIIDIETFQELPAEFDPFVEQTTFNFIPTYSSLDIGSGNQTILSSDIARVYSPASPPQAPKDTPFDNFFSNPLTNEEHITITEENGNWLLDELQDENAFYSCANSCAPLGGAISGASIVCNSNSTFSLSSPPFGGTITWEKSSGLTFVGGSTGTSVTVKAASSSTSESGWVRANINGNCDNFTLAEKSLWVGRPALSGSSSLNVSPLYVDPGDDVYYTHSPSTAPGATSYSEQVTFPPTPQHFTFSSVDDLNGSIYVKTSAPESTYNFIIKAHNTCGYRSYSGSFQVEGSGGGGCGFFCFSVSPNPSGDFIDINAEENPEMQTLSTEATTKAKATEDNKYQFALFDLQHNLVMKGETKKFNARLDVRNINPGHYILHISDKGGTVKQHVLIE